MAQEEVTSEEWQVTKAPSNIPQFVWRLVDVIVGGVFIYAGAIKALDPIHFANDIDNYKVLPWAVSVRLAFYLPWLEILCGIGLIARRLYLGGLSILALLVFIFVTATISAKIRGLDISCGCFGHVSKNWNLPAHLALDLLLFAGLIALWFPEYSRSRVSTNCRAGAPPASF